MESLVNRQLNELSWNNRKLICIFLFLIINATFIFDVYIIRQIIGFIFLTFLPGLFICGILNLKRENSLDILLYSVGLSITFLMSIGLLINTISGFIGIPKPLGFSSLIIVLNFSILLLGLINNHLNKFYLVSNILFDFKNQLSPKAVWISLIPALCIIGTYIDSFMRNNIPLFGMIVVLSVIIILVAFNDELLPTNLYPLTIFVISITLLYHRSLISPYLFGSDSYFEYYVYRLTELNSYWDSRSAIIPCNSMLSITILPTIYSNILNLDGTWVYKLVYPLLFSFVPLGMYSIFEKQIDRKTSMIATIFYMSFITYFTTMLILMRQQIAELFLILLSLVLLDRITTKLNRSILFELFIASLIVSHYGLSYIYILIVVPCIFLFCLVAKDDHTYALTINSVLLCYVLVIFWYIYTGDSNIFNSAVRIFDHVWNSIQDLLAPVADDPRVYSNFFGGTSTIWHFIGRIIINITQLFILIGVINELLQYKTSKFSIGYLGLSFAGLLLIIISIIVPHVASTLTMDRIYTIALLFLSPFFISGGIIIFKSITRLCRFNKFSDQSYLKFITLAVLVPYFLLNTGFIYEVVKDPFPTSIPLSMDRMENSKVEKAKIDFYTGMVQEQDVYNLEWLSRSKSESIIYSDDIRRLPIMGYGVIPWTYILTLRNNTKIGDSSYIYIGKYNNIDGIIQNYDELFHVDTIKNVIDKKSKIYTSGMSNSYL